MSKDTGGPAFPAGEWQETRNGNSVYVGNEGMSLRDYFAAAALQGWLASFGPQHDHPTSVSLGAKRQAQMAYEIADAMLAERSKP